MTVLHCVFVLWQILVYMNDSVVFINKRYFSTTSLQLLRDRYLGFAPLHKKANKVLRGAFYRIAPCLSQKLTRTTSTQRSYSFTARNRSTAHA